MHYAMRPARFVTLCFVYSGLVLLAQYAVVYRFGLALEGLVQLGVALSILAVGAVRLLRPEEEAGNPAEWGLMAYAMAVLCLMVTGILLAQLFVL